MEVVRLGDTVEKMNDYISSAARNTDNKYQELESKMSNNDKNLMLVSQRSSSGSDVVNDLGEKLMNRLNQSESNLLVLGVLFVIFLEGAGEGQGGYC